MSTDTVLDTLREIDANTDGIEGLLSSINTKLSSDYLSGQIEAPQVKTYTFDEGAVDARTINTFKVVVASGSMTASIKINGVTVTGLSAMSITTAPTVFTATALNIVAPDDVITFVVTAVSAPTDMAFTLKYTKP